MRQLVAVLALLSLVGCGGGSSGGGSTSAPTAVATPTPVPTPTPEPIAFGAGQHLLGSAIGGGRYFADPPRSGCYWERNSGLGGTLGEIIANDFIADNVAQAIVDVLGSDVAFTTDSDCGNWYTTPRHGAQATITPGTWLIGDQVAPGTYEANVGAGCYWERVSNFEGSLRSIIANDFIPDAGPRAITIRDGDAGFSTDGDCGTWSPATTAVEPPDLGAQSRSTIERNRDQQRQQEGAPPLR